MRSALAAEILAAPGVLRIEPTLLGAVRSFGRPIDPGQFLHLFEREARLEVGVHVAVDSARSARDTAHDLHTLVGDVIARHGWRAGTIEIAILTIESPPH